MSITERGNSFADSWSSLFELFVSVSGLKLRLCVPDTIILSEGRLTGWYYTNTEGVVCRTSLHEVQPQAVYQKLVGQQTIDRAVNPFGYVALAHYVSGVSRPLKQQELQLLLSQACGPYESPLPPGDVNFEYPFCIQAYIIPMRDTRYLVAFGGPDAGACTVFGRRFSSRYTHATDDAAGYQEVMGAAAANAASRAPRPGGDEAAPTLSAEELLVESQMVAMGLIEPRDAQQGGGAGDLYDEDGAGPAHPPDAALPAPKRAKAEITRLVQGVVSFVERAHGLRIQGLVCEFVQAHPDVFALLAVHAVQWDARASRGRLGTFTDRWADYMSGVGPAPAPRPSSRRAHIPGLLRSSDNSVLVMTERNAASPVGGPSVSASMPQSPLAAAAAAAQGGGSVGGGRGPPYSPAFVQPGDNTHLISARPGSAPAIVLHRFRPQSGVPYGGTNNGGVSLRNAVASARRGAGGNPTANPPSPDSYTLWTPRNGLPQETVAGALTLEVEALKERLQRQADVASRSELALTQLAVSSQATQAGLAAQLEEARAQAAAALAGRRELEAEYERLREERAGLRAELAAAQDELRVTREELARDRATLAGAVRSAAAKEEDLEGAGARLRAENDALAAQVAALQRRLEEEQEVVEAAKSQLLDYKNIVIMLQGQLRRGKNKPAAGTAGALGMLGSLAPGASVALDKPLASSAAAAALNASGGAHPRLSTGAVGLQATLRAAEDAAAGIDYDTMSGDWGNNSMGGAPGQGGGLSSAGAGTNGVSPARRPGERNAPNSASRGNSRAAATVGQQQQLPQQARAPAGVKRNNSMKDLYMSQAAASAAAAVASYSNTPASANSAAAYAAGQRAAAAATAGVINLNGGPPLDEELKQQMAALRRVRNFGPPDQGPQSITAAQQSGLADQKDVVVPRLEPKSEPWKPVYENLHFNDLFVVSTELSDRMTDTLGRLFDLLRSVEPELLDIYNYYGLLGKVRYIESKLAMSEQQFCKLAYAVGLAHPSMYVAEDSFRVIADRVMAYHFDVDGALKEGFITFHEFPEAVCRLGAAFYEWRPPESAEEADDDIEQPESLRGCPLASISELPHAHAPRPSKTPAAGTGGARPMSAVSVASSVVSHSTHGSQAAASIARTSRRGTGSPPRPRPGSQLWDGNLAAGLELGPQPPDVVLYAIIKTFIFNDLLPHAKRNNISGSIVSKQRAQERTTPTDVWL